MKPLVKKLIQKYELRIRDLESHRLTLERKSDLSSIDVEIKVLKRIVSDLKHMIFESELPSL